MLLGNLSARPRRIFPIGAEPRVVDLPSAPPCQSFTEHETYDGQALALPKDGNCSTVVGVVVDDGEGHLWKLILGDENQYVGTGELYPNISTGDFDSQAAKYTRHCGSGCLFDVAADPLETTDLAAGKPRKLKQLRAIVDGYVDTIFFPNRGKPDPAGCAAAEARGGFWGPFADLDRLETALV